MHSVAIIGAGPGGLVAARYLRLAGFAPTLFEQSDGVGGQWRVGAPHSRVWPGMRTNTSRILTAFSDLPHPPGTAVYPSAEQMQAYLGRYAEHFGLLTGARFATRVEHVEPVAEGWRVRSRGPGGAPATETFSRVVVATGWCGRPVVPGVEGLASFTGRGGVTHAAAYRGAAPFRGQRVLVAGGSISALEIASELAHQGAARVVVASRRQRYVAPKLVAGVPVDHVAFTRFAALAAESFPPAAVAAGLKALLVGSSGNPAQVGAPRPADDLFTAGLTLSQHYLPLVAEGRVVPRPWPARVAGGTAHFPDGSAEEVDAILFGTGYGPDLPFLSTDVRTTLGLTGTAADGISGGASDAVPPQLCGLTFHPDLPGAAFVGLFEQIGPHLPTLELQARWVAYAWSGRAAMPAPDAAPDRPRQGVPMQVAARLFATATGVEPDPEQWPALARALYFGPLSPASFRLSGPDALPGAAERVAADAGAFGAGADDALTPDQGTKLRALAEARGDAGLAALVARLAGPGVHAPAGVRLGAPSAPSALAAAGLPAG